MDSDFLVLDSLLAVNGSFVAMQVHLEIAVGNSGFLFVVVFVVMTAMLSGLKEFDLQSLSPESGISAAVIKLTR